MNDDFLTRLRKPPPREFADDLYTRISRPMFTHRLNSNLFSRRVAFAMAMLGLLLSATLLISPAARAFAGEQFRQIGALIFRQVDPDQALLQAEAASPVPTVPAPGDTTPPQQTSLLEDASRLAGFSVVAPGYLPEGYEVDTVWSIDRRESGIYVVSTFRDAAKQQFLLLNQIRYAPGASFEQSLGSNETLSDVEVRGTAGLWITGRLMTDPTDHTVGMQAEPKLYETDLLVWQEGDITYHLFGNGLSQAEMIRIAESLGD